MVLILYKGFFGFPFTLSPVYHLDAERSRLGLIIHVSAGEFLWVIYIWRKYLVYSDGGWI